MRTGSGENVPNLIGFIEKFDARQMTENCQQTQVYASLYGLVGDEYTRQWATYIRISWY